MLARDFAESVTSLIVDQNGYQRLSTRNLILIDMVFESMRHHIKTELARRRGKVKLTVVQK